MTGQGVRSSPSRGSRRRSGRPFRIYTLQNIREHPRWAEIPKTHREAVDVVERTVLLRFLQGRNPDWTYRPFHARYSETATWIDELGRAGD